MRRIGLVILALSLVLAPLVAETQQAARQVKIGMLCAGFCPFPVPEGTSRPLINALERVGLIQGRSLVWDIGGVVFSEDQIVVEAQRLVARRPDLILVWPGNVAAARAAKDATRTIPIVLMAVPDAVENGLVDSLGHPGGNISGISVPLFDLTMKQLQVLTEINPRLKGIIVVHGDLDRGQRQTVDRLRGAVASLRLDAGVSVTEARNVEQALATAAAGVRAVLAVGNMPIAVERGIRVLALERKLPFIMPWRAWEGGSTSTMIVYGPQFSAVAERTVALIDRILKGTWPGDLPVEEPTSYELVIDGVMVKALGLTIPPGVRARADEVTE